MIKMCPNLKSSLITAFLLSFLSGCGGSDEHKSPIIDPPITEVINQTPILLSAPLDAHEGLMYRYSLTFKDPENDLVTVTPSLQPDWLVFDATTQTFSGIPAYKDVGEHIITFQFSDSENQQTKQQVFKVQERANTPPILITTKAAARAGEAFSLTLQVSDVNSDPVSVSIAELPNWLSFNSRSFELTGIATDADVAELTLNVSLSDARVTTVKQLIITISPSYVETALVSGNALDVPNSELLLDAALAEVDAHSLRFQTIKQALFQYDSQSPLTALSWNPTWDATLLKAKYPFNQTVLYTNNSWQQGYESKEQPLAIAGNNKDNSGRYLVFGSNPFRTEINQQMQTFLGNSSTWLAGRNINLAEPLKLVMAQLDESYYFKDQSQTRLWFDTHFADNVSYNEAGACDNTALTGCLTDDIDVLIISQHLRTEHNTEIIAAAVKQALARDIAVLYIQRDGSQTPLGQALFELMNINVIADNYWHRLELKDWDSNVLNNTLPAAAQVVKDLLLRFKNDSFTVDLSSCDTRSCPDQSQYQQQFADAAEIIKNDLREFDLNKRMIFESEGHRFHKLLALLGDHYRQTVTFPMDKLSSDTNAFFKSLFADHSVVNLRKVNPKQTDLGNFSRSDFSHVTPKVVTVTMVSKPKFRSAGVYALPGQTFSITRTDNQAVSTKIFVNSLRDGATHFMSENGYNRPSKLQSIHVPVASNETVYFTSPYGGPIQVEFDKNNISVSFKFESVGQHPYWRSPVDDVLFAEQLEKGDFDWAEVATDGFEIHSKLEKMRQSINEGYWPVASDFANAVVRYTHNYPHVLAGFKGPGISVVNEIHDFATSRNLEVQTIDIVKHMNADQPTCGWGCSGNPYDAGWNFNPVGHGDIHELGHGLEKGRFRIDGFGGHSNTNFYSYYTKSLFEDETGNSANCQSLPFESLFNHLQHSKKQPDPFAYMQGLAMSEWSQSHAIYLQIMMAAQAYNKLENGWHLYPRLHIIERAFSQADNNESNWQAQKNALGFNDYTLAEAKLITNNDWLLIALSEVTSLNLSNYFTLWGMATSAKAQQQVNSKNYPVLGDVYFAASEKGYCSSLNHTQVEVDGAQIWPNN
ncbi:ImpA family metalloprotease [Pseudoalteromonas sp. NEC-BIFX-2020_015]|uniref:ImpA family metalloprotease n=1 Tax=Pseudoalteromonas sp. NEC-BIFX-2020_015 TaxID=2729544 RepID=UPI001461413A|nr:ImpA family metalloprotease [Pseudoalteromonas sp. NEC-BIFX-2020_015]